MDEPDPHQLPLPFSQQDRAVIAKALRADRRKCHPSVAGRDVSVLEQLFQRDTITPIGPPEPDDRHLRQPNGALYPEPDPSRPKDVNRTGADRWHRWMADKQCERSR